MERFLCWTKPGKNFWPKPSTKKATVTIPLQIDAMKHVSDTTYTCFTFKDDRVIQHFQDKHMVRFLFPKEVEYFLERNNLKAINMCRVLKP